MPFRFIARPDVKALFLVRGIRFEGLRKIGLPADFARKIHEENNDEMSCQSALESLYGQNRLVDLVSSTARKEAL